MQAVARRGRARLSVPSALAAVALVGLLAAGFGALGGRPDGSIGPGAPAASGGIAVDGPSQATPTGPLRTPAVTPYRTCRSLLDAAPDVLLRVDRVTTPGIVQIVAPAPDPTSGLVGRLLDVPADADTEIWIGREVCAHAWRIALASTDGDRLLPLELRPNPALDAAFASQNRFDIRLAEYRFEGGDLELRAALEFPGLELVATWPVRFLPFERPQPRLLVAGEDRYFPTVEGCDVVLTFRNGVEEHAGRDCEGDLGLPSVQLEPGTPLRLIFDGWSVTESSASCRTLVPSRDPPTCWDEPQEEVQFVAPRAGDWMLEIAACAVDGSGFESNRICGTWFVRVVTQTRQG